MDSSTQRRTSISTRLTLMVAGILTLAVLVSGGVDVFEQQRQLNHALQTKATSLVQFMAQVTPLSILSLNFVEMNNNVKKVVLTDEEAVYAIIVNDQGVPLAYFFKDANPLVTDKVRYLEETRRPLVAVESMKQSGRILEVTAPIFSGENHIGSAILGLSFDQMRGALVTQMTTIIIFLIIIIGLSIAVLRLILQRILRPVQALTAAAIQISTGDLNVTLTGTDRADELGILANAFKSMADQLRGLIVGLERHLAELKRTSQALQESEERFRAAFENANVAVCLVATSGNLMKVNDAMCKMFGYSREDLEQMNINTIAYPDDQDISPTFIQSAILGEANQAIFDKRYIHKEGHILWGHVSTSLVRGSQGEPLYFISHVQDVTAQKQAEAALRAKTEELDRYFTNALDLLCIADTDGYFRRLNPAWSAMLGFSISELEGQRFLDFVHPDDMQETVQTLSQLANQEEVSNFVNRYRCKNGEYRWIEWRSLPSGKNIYAVARDITEHKQAEAQLRASEQLFRALVENSPDFIARYDQEFRRIYVNPAIQKLFGGASQKVLGTTPADQSPVYAPQVYIDHLKYVIETATEDSIEMPFRTAQGEIHWGHMRFVPEFGPDGKVESVLAIGRDIHEIKENERRFRMLAENFPDFVIRFNRGGQYIYVNPAFEKAFGKPAESIIGKTLQEMPHVSKMGENDTSLALIRRAFNEGVITEAIAHRNTEVGERIFEERYVPEKDATGNVINVLCIARDITEQKQAEEALRASENRFRVLSENAFVGIYIIQDGCLSYVNSTLAEIFGYTPEELTGAEPALVIHPDDQAIVSENIRRRIVGEIETVHYEFRGRCKDGSTKNIEVLGGRIDFGGRTAVIGNLMDITDRKRAEDEIARSLAAEKKARMIAEILREANESLSRTLQLDDVLQNLLDYLMRLIPYDSANVMLRKGDFHFHVVALRGYERWTNMDATQKLVFDIRTIPSLNELFTTKKSIMIANTYQYPGWLRVTGTEHVASWLGIPIIADGQVIGLYSVDKAETDFFTDEHRLLAEGLAAQAAVAIQNTRLHDQITRSNMELEQRVASRTAQLEAANHELEAFAYSVSHDLRAPLRHIDGFIEMLRRKTQISLDEQSQHYMENISGAANRMGTLIEDLLAFSRMGRQEISSMEVDLNELVYEVLDDLEPEMQDRKIEWQISSLPFVVGDRAMLRIVLINLISNALKFTRARNIAQIEIGSKKIKESEIIIFVRDNGVGFDMAYTDKLFGVFQRLHRADEFEGTGIGLASVRRIINRHGGNVWAEGKVDQGATFYFTLPQSMQEQSSAKEAEIRTDGKLKGAR